MGELIMVIGVLCSAGLFVLGGMLAGTPYLTQTHNGSFIAMETLVFWFLAVVVLLASINFGIGVDHDSR